MRPKRTRRGVTLAISDLASALSCIDTGEFGRAADWIESAIELAQVAQREACTIEEKQRKLKKMNKVSAEQMQREIDRASEIARKRLREHFWREVETG